MAFANLFTRLSAVEEGVTSPGQPAFTHRKKTENGREDSSRKRKNQVEPTGPYKKQKKKPEGQKNQHQQKDRRRPANRGGHHQTRPAWRNSGGDRKNKNDKQDVQVKRTRFMSQEFKDQNAVLVDGRLVCRHFLWGRCIKDAECQLEHIQGYNDLFKELCKFYVQGLCTKGESCPYMHKSFPCKFFHRKGKCSQGADCRFSHEPLNDVTNHLLSEAIKRENDLYELTKKAEQKSSGQPENTESEIIEANKTPDTLLDPLRPNFYNSTETKAEKETSCQTKELVDTMEEAVPPHASAAVQPHNPLSSNLNHEEPVCYSVEAVLGPQLSKPFPSFFKTPGSQDSDPLSSSDGTSGSANQSEVPYSVGAFLRSYKSVESSTFVHTPTPPTAQTVSYTPKTDYEEITNLYSVNNTNEVNNSQEKMFKSLSSLQTHIGLVPETCPRLTLASGNYKKQGGNIPESPKPAQRAAHEVNLELIHSPDTVAEKSASSEHKGDMKGDMNLPTDITCSGKSEGVLSFGDTNCKSISSRPPTQTSTSKHPTQLRPHLSVLPPDTQASIKPVRPFSGFTEFKGGAAVPVGPVTSSIKISDSKNSGSHHFVAKQPTEVHLHSKKTQPDLKHGTQQHHLTGITAKSSSKLAHCGDLAVESENTLRRPFHSLFASPVTDTLPSIDDSLSSSSCPQGLNQSSCAASQSADCRSNNVKSVAEPDKASARSFVSLFAAPLSAAPRPIMQSKPDYSMISSCSQKTNQSVDNTPQLSNFEQRASNLETPLPRQVRTDVKEVSHVPRFPNFSPDPKIENKDSSTEHINPPTKQLVNPVCSLVSDPLSEMSTSPAPRGNSPSAAHANQQPPNISSHKGSTNSVLKTLFVCLSPYKQDGEQQDSIQISDPSVKWTKAARGVSL